MEFPDMLQGESCRGKCSQCSMGGYEMATLTGWIDHHHNSIATCGATSNSVKWVWGSSNVPHGLWSLSCAAVQQSVIADWGYSGCRSYHGNTRGHPPVSTHQHEVIYHATLLSQVWPGQLHPQLHHCESPVGFCVQCLTQLPQRWPPGGHESQRIQGAEGWGCNCHWFLYHGQLIMTMHHIRPLCDPGDGASQNWIKTDIWTTAPVTDWASSQSWSIQGSYGLSKSWICVVISPRSGATLLRLV